jgi:hypothetical protein
MDKMERFLDHMGIVIDDVRGTDLFATCFLAARSEKEESEYGEEFVFYSKSTFCKNKQDFFLLWYFMHSLKRRKERILGLFEDDSFICSDDHKMILFNETLILDFLYRGCKVLSYHYDTTDTDILCIDCDL